MADRKFGATGHCHSGIQRCVPDRSLGPLHPDNFRGRQRPAMAAHKHLAVLRASVVFLASLPAPSGGYTLPHAT